MFVPDWAKDVVWYQIFPERFRNGDAHNDPRIEDLEGSWPHQHTSDWHIHPWTADWYKPLPYEQRKDEDFWHTIRRRRYGGDLQGILDQLDYLTDLGVNALYLNPVFEAPSEHKYDGATYHHIDPTFGPDPTGDRQLMAQEIPHDPATWVWTAADNLMLQLIEAVHQRGMRIIFDGVFNHMGLNSWAFRDVVKHQQASRYKDWFKIKSWANPQTGETFAHQGWFGCYELPELSQDENGIVAGPRAYIFAATQRWMDPNQDGDPGDGIDGWRLDVAFCVKHPFWKAWRQHVRAINPEAYLVAEVIEPVEKLKPYLQGDEFDAMMNYNFAFAAAEFFIQSKPSLRPSTFDDQLRQLREAFPAEVAYVMQNLFGSHDTARLATHIVNHDLFDYRDWFRYHGAARAEHNPAVQTCAPTPAEQHIQKLFAIFQMTYVGAPMIYYGDEAGMWGASDPCCRKPMLWPDLDYEPERYLPDGEQRETAVPVTFDTALFHHYQKLIHIRRASPALRRGRFDTLLTDDARELYAFGRVYQEDVALVLLNQRAVAQSVVLPAPYEAGTLFTDVLNENRPYQVQDGQLQIEVAPQWGCILRLQAA